MATKLKRERKDGSKFTVPSLAARRAVRRARNRAARVARRRNRS